MQNACPRAALLPRLEETPFPLLLEMVRGFTDSHPGPRHTVHLLITAKINPVLSGTRTLGNKNSS